MDDPERYKLLHGPYATPPCRRGDRLECEYRGEEIAVGGLSDAPIPWPYVKRPGYRSLIVCGDLARAVRLESELAISHHWEVSLVTIWKWRKALGVGRMNEGTTALYRAYRPEKITEDAYAKMAETSRTPEMREYQRQQKLGKPAAPATRKALLRCASRAKPREHRRAIAKAVAAYHASQAPPRPLADPADRPWTEADERLLGTTLDRHVAAMLGRTVAAVRGRRKQLQIPMSRHSRLHQEPKGDD